MKNHLFMSAKTPARELKVARDRMREVQRDDDA